VIHQSELMTVRTQIPEAALVSGTVRLDLEVDFAGHTANYKQVQFNLALQGGEAKISGVIPTTLADFRIEPPSLLTVPIKNEIPVKVEMTWRSI
jgi:hypothetical protein